MQYTELHLHDYYSTLDGLNSPAEYLERAKELGMTHMAQTNHGTLAGHREFQRAAKDAGITPILGVEAYISPTDRFDRRSNAKRQDGTSAYNHIILLAQNETGLDTMWKLNRAAWTEGFYNKPRIDMDLLEEYNDGLIVLSGCMGGLISKAIEAENYDEADRLTQQLKSILGERFFIEVQSHNPENLNKWLLKLADQYNIKPVITSDCHYARREDLWIEEAMLILATNPKRDFSADMTKANKMDLLERYNYLWPDRKMTFEKIEIFLHNATEHLAEMKKKGFDREDIVTNTQVIAGMIGDYPYHQGLDLLPKPKNENPDTLLEKKARAGLRNRGLDKDPKYVARLEEELEIIKAKNFSTYFLIVANMIRWAKSQDIMVGPGRGSAAGSLVCYSLGITEVDPIQYGLLFFRFINPERNDFPDIDTDFQDDRRGEVKEYLHRTFKHVAEILTFTKYQGKNAFNAAAKVLGVPKSEVTKATKKIDAPTDKPEIFYDMFERSAEGQIFNKAWPDVIKLSKRLTGRISQTGKHPAGIVASKEPLENFMPIETANDPNGEGRVIVIAGDMDEVADIGGIKLDALGLKTLRVLKNTLNEVKASTGKEIDLNTIPLNDHQVFKMLADGYTKGIFQAEGPAFTGWLLDTGCSEFNDIVVGSSIARPGPMNTIGPEYKLRKAGKAKVTYEHSVMRKVTEETLGLIVYQEQVMLAMSDLAGMPMATADKVRKIIGKKKDVSEFEKYQAEFIDGASLRVDRAVAEKLWHDFEQHAGYSFNKSHAVAYGLLTYWTAWFKVNYPREFMVSLLRSEDDKDKVTEYLIEAKRLGIKILLPHVNKSKAHFAVEGEDAIRFGLINVKGIAEKSSQKLIAGQPFENYEAVREYIAKTPGLNVKTLQGLNAIGAAVFEDNPKTGNERDNLYEYLGIPSFQHKELPPRVMNQFRTLDEYEQTGAFPILAMVRKVVRGNGKGWARIDLLDETGTAGVFTVEDTPIEAGQMYAMLISNNTIERYLDIEEFSPKATNSFVKHLYTKDYPTLTDNCYRVVSFRNYTTKAKKRMAYMVVSDAEKNLKSVLVFPTMWAKAHTKCKENSEVFMELRETDEGTVFLHDVY